MNSGYVKNGAPHVLTLTSRGGARLTATITSLWRAQVGGSEEGGGRWAEAVSRTCVEFTLTHPILSSALFVRRSFLSSLRVERLDVLVPTLKARVYMVHHCIH